MHGGVGSWDPTRFPPAMGTYLARRGIALFSNSYRLSKPGHRAPERVALMGQSARAHFAALVARAGDVAPFFLVVSELKLR
jgi:hypothetical protein